MAPLPVDNTIRFRFDYSVNGENHDFQLRSDESPGAIGATVDDFLGALADELFLLTINQVNFAAAGSSIFLPVSTGIEGHTFGIGAGTTEQKAWYVDFIGRSTGGRKWKCAIFGIRTMGGDFRYLSGENASVGAAIDSLNAASPAVLGIDGLPVNVYAYANAGVNAHWQRALRP